MNRLDGVRESLRLALQELDGVVGVEARPAFWVGLWERYVESQADYRASAETTGRARCRPTRRPWRRRR